jgi:D-amino peptidase
VAGKFVVLSDLEGAAGVRNPHECYPNFPEYQQFGVPNQQDDANAAAEGLLEGGAAEVRVVDGHLTGANLMTARAAPGTSLSKGTLLDELKAGGVAGVFLTGIHGKTGTPNSFSSATIAPWVAARLDGDIIGDTLVIAYLCGSFGVPLVGVSGDWVACEELQWALPAVPTAATKTGFDRSSVRHHDAAAARLAIRAAGKRAASAAPGAPLKARRNFRFELSFADPADADAAAGAVDGAAQRKGRVLSYVGGDFLQAMELSARAVGALYPGWVDGLGRRAVPAEPSGRTAGGLLSDSVIERFYGPTAPYWSD